MCEPIRRYAALRGMIAGWFSISSGFDTISIQFDLAIDPPHKNILAVGILPNQIARPVPALPIEINEMLRCQFGEIQIATSQSPSANH